MGDTKRIWLKVLRIKKGLFQKEVAKELGIGVSTYACYELGTRTPLGNNAFNLARFFDFPMEWLYESPDAA